MLRVNVEQAHRHLAQLVETHGRVVDEGPAATAARELAPQYDLTRTGVEVVGFKIAVDALKT